MSFARLPHCSVWLCLGLALTPARAVAQGDPKQLAAKARDILVKHCFDCHGKDPKKLRGSLNLFDPAQLADKERNIVVPRDADNSKLIVQVETDKMPPGPITKRPLLTKDERKVLRDWVAAGAQALPALDEKTVVVATPDEDPAVLAGRVKEIFRARCSACHGGPAPVANIVVLDQDNLINKTKVVVAGKPEESRLFRRIASTDENYAMPPDGKPRLTQDEINTVRRWITNGAPALIAKGKPALPQDVKFKDEEKRDKAFEKPNLEVIGVNYVLKSILTHVRSVKPKEDRRFMRYFSFNHILIMGASEEALKEQRAGLVKALNHLSWLPNKCRPQPIEETNTVFVVDIRDLGWQATPFQRVRQGKVLGDSSYNLFDLVLLEYPYSVIYDDSETFDSLVEEFLQPAGQVRPIPYLRADWFVGTATLPPLYEDLLQLPFTLQELEDNLKINAEKNVNDYVARRGGMSVSLVSRNNRVVERHPLRGGGYGGYWKSFDFRSNTGMENIFADPINLHPAGGEIIFSLPNGLQAYYVANGKGNRVEFAPTDIVTDRFASDKTVRTGLSCMRCHDQGMKTVPDVVRPALEQLPGTPGFDLRSAKRLYAEQPEMKKLVEHDGEIFRKAMKDLLGYDQIDDPLIPVTKRFLDEPLYLNHVAGELGLNKSKGLEEVFRSPSFTALGLVPLTSPGGMIRRDTWEDYYDLVVRRLGLGTPITPVDGLNRRDYPTVGQPFFEVLLTTNKRGGVVEVGDKIKILVENKSDKTLYIELIGTSAQGKKVILTAPELVVKPHETYTFPSKGDGIPVKGGLGKEQVTLFASDTAFPAGEVLQGKGVSDRVVHPFYHLEAKDGRFKLTNDPVRIVKKSLDIETR